MQGKKTHEQFERIIHNDEKTKGLEDVGPMEPLNGPINEVPDVNDMRTGDRSIRRGSHQATEHFKRRADD